MPWLIAHFDAAQPFHPHIPFPTRHDKTQRIALFRAQRLAVHLEGDKTIIKRLFHRNGTGHARGIRPFWQDPCAICFHPCLFKQQAQGHACIDHVVDHPMGILTPVQLRATPFHP